MDLQDGIAVFENVLPEGACEHLIAQFEENIAFSETRQQAEGQAKHRKNDQAIFAHSRDLIFAPFNGDQNTLDVFWAGLQSCYDKYVDEFSILSESEIFCNSFKMQKTSEGGGYHVWHCENLGFEVSNRVVTYMLYLNTLPETSNGETEFLYQKRRISPTENTMVLWPAAFTHPHRGNPVYGSTAKYIVTGWFVLR